MNAPLSDLPMSTILDAMIGIDGDFVRMFARAALQDCAEIKCDMAVDNDMAPPSDDDIRQFAVDFVKGQMEAFTAEVLSAINGVQFNTGMVLTPTIRILD